MSAPAVHIIETDEHDTCPDVFCGKDWYTEPYADGPDRATCLACLTRAIEKWERQASEARAQRDRLLVAKQHGAARG